jgi:hypothetical protein
MERIDLIRSNEARHHGLVDEDGVEPAHDADPGRPDVPLDLLEHLRTGSMPWVGEQVKAVPIKTGIWEWARADTGEEPEQAIWSFAEHRLDNFASPGDDERASDLGMRVGNHQAISGSELPHPGGHVVDALAAKLREACEYRLPLQPAGVKNMRQKGRAREVEIACALWGPTRRRVSANG